MSIRLALESPNKEAYQTRVNAIEQICNTICDTSRDLSIPDLESRIQLLNQQLQTAFQQGYTTLVSKLRPLIQKLQNIHDSKVSPTRAAAVVLASLGAGSSRNLFGR
jgi:hypothetical protein